MNVNPILKSLRNFSLYLFGWLLVIISYAAVLIAGFNLSISFTIADSLISNILLAGLGLSFWYSAKYISFEDNSIYKIFLSHTTGGIISSVVWLSIVYYFLSIIYDNRNDISFFINTLPWRFVIGILFYFIITSFYYIIIYYSNFQEHLTKEAELKNLVTEAELKSLKFQINPHFIFNSLNSMSALTTIEPERARSMILKLADFLRYTLANNEKQKNLLCEELKNIRLYLDIEKIRFEDKFEFIEEISDTCLNVMVPNMLLQPLFENAIKHAVYDSIGKVTLKLSCYTENNFMKIRLSNNFEDLSSTKKGAGIGLQNIKERLELIYSQKNLVDVKVENHIFTVKIFIPL